MDLDLRIPVGLLFVTLGLIMTVFGFTSDPAMYQKSLGINVNVQWGIAQLIFGSLMIAFGRSATQAAARRPVMADNDVVSPVVPAATVVTAKTAIHTSSAPKSRTPRA